MRERQSAEFDRDEKALPLLLGELDHRIRNLLMMIEAAVRQTHSTSLEDYRAKLIARITGLHEFYEFTSPYGRMLGLAELLEQTTRPYSANSAQVLAAGPDLELEPSLALALHLVFMSLPRTRTNTVHCSPLGRIKIDWKIRHIPGAPSQARDRLDRARRTGGASSAASRFRFTAYQESTRRIWRSTVGLQQHGSRLLHADRSGSLRRANTGGGRRGKRVAQQTASVFDEMTNLRGVCASTPTNSMPRSVTATPIPC
jgi:two-component sensor histidine kinase